MPSAGPNTCTHARADVRPHARTHARTQSLVHCHFPGPHPAAGPFQPGAMDPRTGRNGSTTTTPLSRRLAPPAAHSGPVIFKAAGRQREGMGFPSSGEATSAPGSGAPAGPHAGPQTWPLRHRSIEKSHFPLAVTKRNLFCLVTKTDSPWALL
jgi:hypothetical protein